MSTENEKLIVDDVERSVTQEEAIAIQTTKLVEQLHVSLSKHMSVLREGIISEDQDMMNVALKGYFDDTKTLLDLIEWLRLHVGDRKDLISDHKPYWID